MKHMKGQCKHERFMMWAKEKMTPEDAMFIKFGEKSKDFPEEMKKEFRKLFEDKKEFRKKRQEEKRLFKEKWHKYLPEERVFSDDGHTMDAHRCW